MEFPVFRFISIASCLFTEHHWGEKLALPPLLHEIPLCLLFSRLNCCSYLSLFPHGRGSNPLTIFVALCWTQSSISLVLESPKQYSQCISQVLNRGKGSSPSTSWQRSLHPAEQGAVDFPFNGPITDLSSTWRPLGPAAPFFCCFPASQSPASASSLCYSSPRAGCSTSLSGACGIPLSPFFLCLSRSLWMAVHICLSTTPPCFVIRAKKMLL